MPTVLARHFAPAPLDFGRDAVTVLGLSAALYLLGVAMLLRVESHRLALAALVVAVVILGIALWDWLDAVECVGGALSGLAGGRLRRARGGCRGRRTDRPRPR